MTDSTEWITKKKKTDEEGEPRPPNKWIQKKEKKKEWIKKKEDKKESKWIKKKEKKKTWITKKDKTDQKRPQGGWLD